MPGYTSFQAWAIESSLDGVLGRLGERSLDSCKFLGPRYGSVGTQAPQLSLCVNFRHASCDITMNELTLRRFRSAGGSNSGLIERAIMV